ncbi:MAG: SUF system NifU family Fe-S cluster assembly protein [Ignavibacteria bacterium]|nr:SUF system NifU family Fe-S cluster assembly protein [Ignavibacteria bacterium]
MKLNELYQTIILEHYKEPHNVGEIANADIETRGYNESCGDDVRLFLKFNNEKKIDEIRFKGKGCAISQSSTSMMTDAIKGKTIDEALLFVDSFKAMMRGEKQFSDDGDYEELSALKGVLEFPVRVKCATLSWNTIRNGLLQFKEKENGKTKVETTIHDEE